MTPRVDSQRLRIATTLVLNNLGCTLLERRCAEQAYAAFHDAIQVAKDEQPASIDVTCHESCAFVTRYMRMGTTHEAQHHQFASSSAPWSPSLPCQTLLYNVSAPDLNDLLSHVPQEGCCRVLRIDVTGSDGLCETPSEVVCAIILLNIANAIRSMPSDLLDTTTSKLDRVLTITNLVATVARKYSSHDDTALFLSHVALDTSIQALSDVGRVGEANELRVRLDFLKEHVQTLLSFLASPGRGPVAAAA